MSNAYRMFEKRHARATQATVSTPTFTHQRPLQNQRTLVRLGNQYVLRMSFSGNTDSAERNRAQSTLASSIGNDSTRPRSIELAIRAEAKLFERMGKRTDGKYFAKLEALVGKLKDPSQKGFDLNRKLLCGELAPEKWMQDEIPEVRPELISSKESTAPSKPAALVPEPVKPNPIPSDENKGNNDSTPSGKGKDGTGLKSSYYFFTSTPKEQAAQYAPKPIQSQAEIEAAAAVPAGVSKWNKGGTWEDRDFSSWAKKRFKELLDASSVPAFADGNVTVKSWTVKSAEASIIFVRGKKKCGYALEAEADFSGEYKGTSVKGKVRVPHFDETDDVELKVSTSSNNEASTVVRRAAMKLKSAIEEHVQTMVKEMKEMC